MIDQLTSKQIGEFERVLNKCEGLSTEDERSRCIGELDDPTVRDLLEAAFEEPVSARNLPPRFRLGDYELTERLGGGGFGEVWRARQLGAESEEVAIKVIRNEHLRGENAEKFVRLFQGEIDRHKALVHDGIVRLIAANSVMLPGCAVTTPFLVMELWDGVRLHDACRGRRIEEKIKCMIQVCEAVQYAHRCGLMHLDLKPENILVAATSGKLQTKIVDFGLARRFRADRPFDSTRFGAGTLPYKAPEQIDPSLGGEDFRTDVYALGVILFQLLTDRLPYPLEEGTAAEYKKFILDGQRMSLKAFDKSIDLKLQQICDSAMATDRSRRYDSPSRLAEALKRWLRAREARPRKRFLLAVTGAACLAIVCTLVPRHTKAEIQWHVFPIKTKGSEKPFPGNWTDLYWDGDEGWLCGYLEEQPVPGKFIGRGLLLHTSDGGKIWEEFARSNFTADSGILSCFEEKTWNGIGPIEFVEVCKEIQADGTWMTNGWVAAWTGAYTSTEAGSATGKWTRITPPPDGPDCYSYFNGLREFDYYKEMYAFGWQGISHWELGGQWEVQLKTHLYDVSQIRAVSMGYGDLWAVANGGGGDAKDWGQTTDYGAIFHLHRPGTNWERIALPGITLHYGQGLIDVAPIRGFGEVLVVGGSGLILKSTLHGTNWVWRQLSSNTQQGLLSIATDSENNLWVVGTYGTILRSSNGGESWVEYPCYDKNGTRIRDIFHRIKFIKNRGWIVGESTVLTCDLP
jgi:photosystem II stability/assembly factor-like uncharacterized protein